jgi:hypothetical protein
MAEISRSIGSSSTFSFALRRDRVRPDGLAIKPTLSAGNWRFGFTVSLRRGLGRHTTTFGNWYNMALCANLTARAQASGSSQRLCRNRGTPNGFKRFLPHSKIRNEQCLKIHCVDIVHLDFDSVSRHGDEQLYQHMVFTCRSSKRRLIPKRIHWNAYRVSREQNAIRIHLLFAKTDDAEPKEVARFGFIPSRDFGGLRLRTAS